MGSLSTHVLDTVAGRAAQGVKIELFSLSRDGARAHVTSAETNADGRTDQPLLSGADWRAGTYELHFHIGDYFRAQAASGAGLFLDIVTLRVVLSEADGHYHVPLLCSPWSYSTYRGS